MILPQDQELIDYFSGRAFPDSFYQFSAFFSTSSLQQYVETNLALLRYDDNTAREALMRLKQKLETETYGHHA